MKKLPAVFIAALLLITSAYAQEKKEKKYEKVQFTIESDKQVYQKKDELTLTVSITNNTDKEITFFWDTKKPVVFSKKKGIYIATARIDSYDETLRIKPKRSIVKHICIELSKNIKPLKGEIKFQFSYSNADMKLDHKDKDIAGQELLVGEFKSNIISIEITTIPCMC